MGLIMNLHVILCKNENFSISFKFSKYLTRVRSFPVILCLFTSPYLMSSYSCHLCSIHADVILCSTVQISEFLPVMCHWSSYLLSLDFTLLIYKMGIIQPSLLGVLWGINKKTYVLHLDKCLELNKIIIFIQYWFSFLYHNFLCWYDFFLLLRVCICFCVSVFISYSILSH